MEAVAAAAGEGASALRSTDPPNRTRCAVDQPATSAADRPSFSVVGAAVAATSAVDRSKNRSNKLLRSQNGH